MSAKYLGVSGMVSRRPTAMKAGIKASPTTQRQTWSITSFDSADSGASGESSEALALLVIRIAARLMAKARTLATDCIATTAARMRPRDFVDDHSTAIVAVSGY
jgi:hypothetical protein